MKVPSTSEVRDTAIANHLPVEVMSCGCCVAWGETALAEAEKLKQVG